MSSGEQDDDQLFGEGSSEERNLQSRFAEQTIIFFSIVKWVLLASVTGGLVGVASAGFLNLLHWGTHSAMQFEWYYLTLPVAFFISASLIRYLAPTAEGHGTEKVIKAIHKHEARIPWSVVPVKLLATLVTLAAGGSAGKEGPTAQIGAGLSSVMAQLLRFDTEDRRKLVICGISAGFSAVFGTPIAGAIFAVEVLFVGNLVYEVMLASFVAGITGFQTTAFFGIEYFNYRDFGPVADFSEPFFLLVLLFGAFMGVVSFILIESLHQTERWAALIPLRKELKALVGGTLLVILALLISKDFLGLGLDTVEATLNGEGISAGRIVWYAFLGKILFTVITLSFGGSGGIVTPIFYIGTTAGALFAWLFNVDVATFAAIGMVCAVAGAANTPIAASIMALEIFGANMAIYAPAACVVAFLATGHRSVYPSQILAVRKSEDLHVAMGGEMEEVEMTEPHLRRRDRRTIFVLQVLRRLDRFLRKTQDLVKDKISLLDETFQNGNSSDRHERDNPEDEPTRSTTQREEQDRRDRDR
jgi:H+/Cl- antiporter ClcA